MSTRPKEHELLELPSDGAPHTLAPVEENSDMRRRALIVNCAIVLTKTTCTRLRCKQIFCGL